MNEFPFLIDDFDAIEFYRSKPNSSNAIKAFVVGILTKSGYRNRKIRDVLGIEKVYTVTHLKRAGSALSEAQLLLWHNNPEKVTLGHVRVIASQSHDRIEYFLRELLARGISVSELASIVENKEEKSDDNIDKYAALIQETLGRDVEICHRKKKGSGNITLSYFSIDDLEYLVESLGVKPEGM